MGATDEPALARYPGVCGAKRLVDRVVGFWLACITIFLQALNMIMTSPLADDKAIRNHVHVGTHTSAPLDGPANQSDGTVHKCASVETRVEGRVEARVETTEVVAHHHVAKKGVKVACIFVRTTCCACVGARLSGRPV